MKNYLFAALLLGSFIASISSESESFDFIDSQGRCWRCTDGSCSSCPAALIPRPREGPVVNERDPRDQICTQPSEADCARLSTAKFPTPDINMYWDCANNFRIARRCECDTGFDPAQQLCVKSHEITSIGCREFWNTDIFKCDNGNGGGDDGNDGNDGEATTTVSTTTPNPCICIPFWPCRCNPCWSMPCHSCNGCRMMMG